jgi:AcrR family transcriptional regulator
VRRTIIDAAFTTLRDRGYAECSARAIAAEGGFNQAKIFYYFGSVNSLLVAALEASSLKQLAAYRDAVGGVTSVVELLAVVRERVEDDLATGHVRVLTELIGASSTDAALRAKVRELFEPWVEMTRETVARVTGSWGLGEVLPSEQAAYAIVCFFLGVQQMVTLSGDAEPALELFSTAQKAALMFETMFPSTAK